MNDRTGLKIILYVNPLQQGLKHKFSTGKLKNDDIDKSLIDSYEGLEKMKRFNDGNLWSQLTKEEQDELILSDIESEDENNLISHSEVLKKNRF